MRQLPKPGATKPHLFFNCGTDYAGPLLTHQGGQLTISNLNVIILRTSEAPLHFSSTLLPEEVYLLMYIVTTESSFIGANNTLNLIHKFINDKLS